LSGGEKTIATLALFITLNIVLKTPFLILDEADAYLDSYNTGKYLLILKDLAETLKMQCIVVTHKPAIFENAQSLVGVTFLRKK